ncbi:MAG: alpha/beta hydrolase [Bacteroidota bacterium]|nr:alpha/beta hydrolase [Bacteroidota bacterium]
MLALARPGYNKSRQCRTVNDIDTQTLVLTKLIEMNKWGKKEIVIGRSYGSPIAAMATAQHPEWQTIL